VACMPGTGVRKLKIMGRSPDTLGGGIIRRERGGSMGKKAAEEMADRLALMKAGIAALQDRDLCESLM